MTKVYLAIAGAPDRLLGRVDVNGNISRSQTGFDDQVGRVDLRTGDVYQEHFGPDKKVGRVDLKNGKVYLSRLGPDAYMGRVDDKGRMHLHRALAADDYVGNVDEFLSYAQSAGAMLLLVLPALEPDRASQAPEEEETDQ